MKDDAEKQYYKKLLQSKSKDSDNTKKNTSSTTSTCDKSQDPKPAASANHSSKYPSHFPPRYRNARVKINEDNSVELWDP